MNLLANIKELHFRTSIQIQNLNAGGCGIFCYMMYNKLQELGIDCKIVGLDLYDINYKKSNVQKYLNGEKKDNNLACSHYVVEIEKDLLIDGYYIYQSHSDVDYGKSEYFTVEELKVALDFGGWNGRYNRGQNALLAEIIEESFETKKAA